ncbi:MAG TPA: methyltransferase domain-containing protein, partial [Acidimicrobiia bacterium]|nr:methyltransferase domain-containing protein [Acidimicrobiia bacterium]
RAEDGTALPLDPGRWHAEPTPGEARLVEGMAGPVLDVGCGPGRFVIGLAQRGTVALGVDPAPAAVALCRSKGAPVLQKSVFDPLPGQGRWRTVLLADGNIGIGGDPERLLRRCAELLASDGTVIVEVEAPSTHPAGWRPYRARLERGGALGPWFAWAVVGADAIGALARAAGLRLRRLESIPAEGRWFAHLGSNRGAADAGA